MLEDSVEYLMALNDAYDEAVQRIAELEEGLHHAIEWRNLLADCGEDVTPYDGEIESLAEEIKRERDKLYG